jgi:hypothetical protein
MPWCDPCARFYNPNTLGADGSCPSCGRVLTRARSRGDAETGAAGSAGEAAGAGRPVKAGRARAPWHFWLLLAMAAVYLGWRAVQGIIWVIGLI